MPDQTVLLVEDNDDNLRIYSTILTYSGYSVIEATDGEAAIAAAREHHPGLILMDVSIPKIDGWEATRRLKADAATRHIPVIALTAHAMSSDRVKALEAGCDDYDTKPVELTRLLDKIEALLSKGDMDSPSEPIS